MEQLDYAFRIVGSPVFGQRRLVSALTAYSAYASCDERCQLDCESYLSTFWYGSDFATHLLDSGGVKNYCGVCWSPWLWFDIDRETNLVHAQQDTATLANHLVNKYQVDPADLLIFFSGSKGFHLGLPLSWQPAPSVDFHRHSRLLAETLAAECRVSIDPAIYTATQPFRAPNSRHKKTGLHKRLLSFDTLQQVTIDEIKDLATVPTPFTLVITTSEPNTLLRNKWNVALSAAPVPINHSCNQSEVGGISSRLNRLTLDFIRQGASVGDRHRLLFSAAANLAEFGCTRELAYALLTEPALDGGLSPTDARRQIDCGWSKGGVV